MFCFAFIIILKNNYMCLFYKSTIVIIVGKNNIVGNFVRFQQKSFGKSHKILLSFLCKRTIATEFNLQKHKTRKNLAFSAGYCPFFSGISVAVLVLFIGACESEGFPTTEYNKSQK